MPDRLEELPREQVGGITRGLSRFLRIEAAAGALLLAATVIALVASNSVLAPAYLGFWETRVAVSIGELEHGRTLRSWINDGLMTAFFFVIALELKRELVLGELSDVRAAGLSLAGALGGMLAPVALFLAVIGDRPGAHGWGVAMATDTAFVMGCLALFGRRAPVSLRVFLLSLAIFDDVGAILVVAVAYGHAIAWPWIAVVALGLAVIAGAARLGIRHVAVYLCLGAGVWFALDRSGVHATVAGVALGLMTPTGAWVKDARLRAIFGRLLANPPGERWSGDTSGRRDLRRAATAAHEALSPAERLEMALHPWVGFAVMPLFALANAGVALSTDAAAQPLALALAVALVAGKPAGVVGFAWLATRLGLASRPPALSWSVLAAGALLTGIGFTMSLFVAGLAFSPALIDAAKLGVFAGSAVAAASGMLALLLATRRSQTWSCRPGDWRARVAPPSGRTRRNRRIPPARPPRR